MGYAIASMVLLLLLGFVTPAWSTDIDGNFWRDNMRTEWKIMYIAGLMDGWHMFSALKTGAPQTDAQNASLQHAVMTALADCIRERGIPPSKPSPFSTYISGIILKRGISTFPFRLAPLWQRSAESNDDQVISLIV